MQCGSQLWGTLFNNRGLVTEFQYNSVPVPGAIWLLGSGIIGLVAFRRRKS
ncbi:MAG TPA: VPLPA-CTERM sorting domain-containing protein [Deltaproteobacteria bacterium]|nr:VPLPA-CTERM sorting domain-containing protein [Deltaproteobacteria bacterium]